MNQRCTILHPAKGFALLLPTARPRSVHVAARARRVTKTVPGSITRTVTGANDECLPPFERAPTTTRTLMVAFSADTANCGLIELFYRTEFGAVVTDVQGGSAAPGGSTGAIDLGPQRGAGTIQVFARDAPDGTRDGPLASWGEPDGDDLQAGAAVSQRSGTPPRRLE